MTRFAGIKHNHIFMISNVRFESDLQVIEIPSELDHLSSDDIILNGRVHDNKIIIKNAKKLAKDIKVAFVGNWKMKCGIATFQESLCPEIIKLIGDYKLFIEENDSPTGDIYKVGDQLVDHNKVSVCWKRGQSLSLLVKEIKKYNPDIVCIQHEFGIFPNAGYWISLMSQLSDYRVIVTMHSIFHHKDKTICEAAMPEIITHLQGGKDLLKNEKQIAGKVHVIPHGCDSNIDQSKLWNFYKTERTFLQMGFLFNYKGWQLSLETAAILKQKYPDVFFTGLCSESPYAKKEHQIYYNELMDLIEKLDIQDNVALIRGFQSDATLDSYLRTNKAALFPYVSSPQHEVFGASGAARLAMSKGLPVITSSVNHFSDLNSIKANTPQEMADELDKLFTNPDLVKAQVELQNQYIKENSWANIAQRYIKIFEE